MRIRKKRTVNKLLCLLLGICILLGIAPTAAIPAGAAKRSYTTLAELGVNDLWHYNGILFGNWRAKQADVEGAIAVAGGVRLAEVSSFTIGANADTVIMGDYDPSTSPYPVGILGFDPANGGTIRLGPSVVTAYGDIVMRQGAEAAYNAQPRMDFHQGGGEYFADADLIDNFFATAKSTAGKIQNVFDGASNAWVTAEETFDVAWYPPSARTLLNTPASTYLSTVQGENGESVLVVNFSNKGYVNLGALYLSHEYADYDLIVMNFPYATNVNFRPMSNIHLPSGAVFGNTNANGPKDKWQKQVEWANRMVWLFPQATDISVDGAAVVGSVIAPGASLIGNGGSINGMLIAKDLTQEAGFELHAFQINPLVPKLVDKEPEPDKLPRYRSLQIAKLDEEIDSGLGTRALPEGAFNVEEEETLHTVLPGARFRLEAYNTNTGAWVDYYAAYLNDSARGAFVLETGITILYDLLLGLDYRLVEIEPPPGYAMPSGDAVFTYFSIGETGEVSAPLGQYFDKDGNERLVYGHITDSVRMFNRKLETMLTLRKMGADTGNALAGAIFRLRRMQENGQFVTINNNITSGTDGILTLPALTEGTYRLYEREAPAGYAQPPLSHFYTITVTLAPDKASLVADITDWDGQPLPSVGEGDYVLYEIYNTADVEDGELRVEFLKIDENDDPLAGAVFNIYKETLEPENGYDFVYDDSDVGSNERYWLLLAQDVVSQNGGVNHGIIHAEYDVAIGDTFLLLETKAPDGYNIYEKPRIYEVGLEEDDDPNRFVFRYTFLNLKQGTEVGSFRFAKTDDEPEKNPVYGASFMLFRYIGGNYVYTGRSVTLNDSNEFVSERLPAGMYQLRESHLPEGFVLEDEEARNTYFVIDVNATGQSGSGTHDDPYIGCHIGADSPVIIENTPFRSEFRIIKLDRANDERMAGVTFTVYYRANILEDWAIYDRDFPDGRYTTDENGEISAMLREGMYWLQEIETWEGYKVTSPRYYTVIYGVTPDTVELREFNELTITGEMPVYKVDAADMETRLHGSSYRLYSAQDHLYRPTLEELQNGTLTLQEVIADTTLWRPYPDEENNTFTIPQGESLVLKGLESGLYKLVEVEPPNGYTLWGDSRDIICFEMAYGTGPESGETEVTPGEIFGNHTNETEALVFANQAGPKGPDTEDPSPEKPGPEEPEKPAPGEPDGSTITIKKVDYNDNSKALANTTFSLMRYGFADADELLATILAMEEQEALALLPTLYGWRAFPGEGKNVFVTEANGTVDVGGLTPGVYRIEEIIPPPGYLLWNDARDVIYFVVEPARDPEGNASVASVLGAHVQDSGAIVFADIPETDVPTSQPNPQTGDYASRLHDVYILLCTLALVTACLALACKRRMKHKQ